MIKQSFDTLKSGEYNRIVLLLSVLVALSCNLNSVSDHTEPSAALSLELAENLNANLMEIIISSTDIDTIHYFTPWSQTENIIEIPIGENRIVVINAFLDGTKVGSAQKLLNTNENDTTSLVISIAKTAVSVPSVPSQIELFIEQEIIHLNWNADPNAEYYLVVRSCDTIQSPVEFIVNEALFIDSTPPLCTTVYYAVSTVTDAGQSVRSAYHVVALSPAETTRSVVPGTPENVIAVATDSEIKLTWNTCSGATTYIIFRSTDTNSSPTAIDTTNDALFIDTALSAATVYYYRITAGNAAGYSPFSLVYKSKTTELPVVAPDTPKKITAVPRSESSIELTWDNVISSEYYRIHRAEVHDSGNRKGSGRGASLKSDSLIVLILIDSTTDTIYADLNLNASTMYYYAIEAVNRAGSSPYSDTVMAMTENAPVDKPSVPNALTVQSFTHNTVTLVWESISGASSYTLYRSSVQEGPFTTVFSTGLTVVTDTGLSSNTTYYYSVSATSSAGESELSTAVSVTTDEPSGPATPEGLSAEAISSTEISISFSSVIDADSYTLYFATSSSGSFTLLTTITSTSYTHTGLSAGTTRYYKVSSINTNGESDLSSPVSATTPNDAPSKYAVVNQNICKGCRRFFCNSTCENGAVSKVGKKAVIDPDKCDGCGECVSVCPSNAIKLYNR